MRMSIGIGAGCAARRISIPITPVMWTMLTAIIVLHIVNLFAQRIVLTPGASDAAIHFKELFTVNSEGRVPTWYSAAALLLCASLLLVIGCFGAARRFRLHWLSLSAIFLFISMDEASGLHDEMSGYLYQLMPTGGALYNTWVVPAGIGVILLGVWMWRFILSLPRTTQGLFVLAAFMYVGGALGLEIVGSIYLTTHDFNSKTPTYALLATLEELFEMSGVAVFVYALLSYIQSQRIELRVDLRLWRRCAVVLGCAIVVLIVAGVAGQVLKYEFGRERLLGFVRLFDLDGEGNASAWFSSMLLFLCAMVCGACALHPGRKFATPRMWWILSVAMMFLSFDEFVSVHELSIEPVRAMWQTDGLLRFPWVIGGAAAAAAVFALCLADLRRLPVPVMRLITLSGAIYVSGALGVEMMGGWWSSNHGEINMTYQLIVACEESLELLGAALFICCAAHQLAVRSAVFAVDADKSPSMQTEDAFQSPFPGRRAA